MNEGENVVTLLILYWLDLAVAPTALRQCYPYLSPYGENSVPYAWT